MTATATTRSYQAVVEVGVIRKPSLLGRTCPTSHGARVLREASYQVVVRFEHGFTQIAGQHFIRVQLGFAFLLSQESGQGGGHDGLHDSKTRTAVISQEMTDLANLNA